MSESPEPELERVSTRHKLGHLLWALQPLFVSSCLTPSRHHTWDKGKEKSIEGLHIGKERGIEGLHTGKERAIDGLLKTKLSLEHKLGLGHKPNVVPPGEARIDDELRTVEIGWHPVAGMAGNWFAEKSGLGKMITDHIGGYPDPTQHWAVLVGDYVHELWMDEDLDVIYINEVLNREEWHTFEVGKTRFTDEALRQAGEMVIHNMREKRKEYNVISNNCQNYAVAMLDAIQIGAHVEFATSFAVYQAATGNGTIKELFADKHPEEQKIEPERPGIHRTDTVQNAQQVMEEHTTKIDNHKQLFG